MDTANTDGPLHMLVVEDNEGDIRMVKEVVKYLNLNCILHFCVNGQEAIDFINNIKAGVNKHPGLVLLDLNLPSINGKEILKRLKSDDDLHYIPTIVFSSSHDPLEVKDIYYNQANGYIIKPFEVKDYMEILKSVYEFWLDTARLPNSRFQSRYSPPTDFFL